jgi:hypothetical protein
VNNYSMRCCITLVVKLNGTVDLCLRTSLLGAVSVGPRTALTYTHTCTHGQETHTLSTQHIHNNDDGLRANSCVGKGRGGLPWKSCMEDVDKAI